MSEAWRLQRALLLRKVARLRADNEALKSELALLRMRRVEGQIFGMPPAPRVMVWAPEPMSEEDDPPR